MYSLLLAETVDTSVISRPVRFGSVLFRQTTVFSAWQAAISTAQAAGLSRKERSKETHAHSKYAGSLVRMALPDKA